VGEARRVHTDGATWGVFEQPFELGRPVLNNLDFSEPTPACGVAGVLDATGLQSAATASVSNWDDVLYLYG
jgi:hypothetical protein